ncbi:hypothetical protein D1007_24860 [Hordeum vulgare]|nr:hypothetical protein D1007_24860 [Hordeum vulgare]
MRYNVLDCVSDNAHRFEDGKFPVSGSIVPFGEHRIYIAVVPDADPVEVLSYDELLSSNDDDLSSTSTTSTPT